MKARDIMTKDVIAVTADTSVMDLIKILLEQKIAGVPVVDSDDNLIGIVTEKDIVRGELVVASLDPMYSEISELLRPHYEAASDKRDGRHFNWVEEIMNPDVLSAHPDDDVRYIAKIMYDNHIHRVPIVENDKLVGIVSSSDILKIVSVGTLPIP